MATHQPSQRDANELHRERRVSGHRQVSGPEAVKALKALTPSRVPFTPNHCSNARKIIKKTPPSTQIIRRNRAIPHWEPPSSRPPKKVSTYSKHFGEHLKHWDISLDLTRVISQAPYNAKEFRDRLARPRSAMFQTSLGLHKYDSLVKEMFTSFLKMTSEVMSEDAVMKQIWPCLIGGQEMYCKVDCLFDNLVDLTDGSIVWAKPDFCDGSDTSELRVNVEIALRKYVVPSTMKESICLPNFFMEAKGPGGVPLICQRQAAYDGALGARGIHAMRQYVDESDALDHNAYTITSTLVCGGGECILTIFVCYVTHGRIGDRSQPPKIQMTKLRRYDLCDSQEAFVEGVTALRNARDLAYDMRIRLIAAANTAAKYKELLREQERPLSNRSSEVVASGKYATTSKSS
ncbi:MAG: hypothetical protein M1828_005020 [Chrysothrix sp. TS-e1954]|nr:MAG: hypothetical protein M1828_005020 [Chrysothrix sp. TS-e1954]